MALCICICLVLGTLLPVFSLEKVNLQGGVQMGYALGQNGAAWPSPLKDPISNNNRGGFYITQLRLHGVIPFDSTFFGVFTGNFIFMDPQEAYLEKRWDTYSLKAGKFRGAGLKSGSGTDEFQRLTVNTNRYARFADFYERTIGFRDFGIQVERNNPRKTIQQKLFIHNANRQNVLIDEPSFNNGPVTQVLGIDYALDWRVSPFTVFGGHVGALANRSWDEFLGSHKPYEVGYWLKSNAIVDASIYQQMDFTKLHLQNEALILLNREQPSPIDSTANQLWGMSSQIRVDHSAQWSSFFHYEFFDPSNGLFGEDNLQMLTLGGIFHPSPNQYPGMKFTGEYVRSLEEGAKNTIPNDLLYIQLQMMF